MANNTNISALSERFPIGSEVVNLGCIRAMVDGYNVHSDGSVDLLCREIRRDGTFMPGRFTANPDKCQPVGGCVRVGNVVFG